MDRIFEYNQKVRANNRDASKTEIDTFTKMSFISSLKVLENKKEAVFVRTTCDKEKNVYVSNLYLLDTNKKIRQLSSDGKVSSFFVGKSPQDIEDRAIYFFAKRSDEEKDNSKNLLQESALYRLSLNGGEALKVWTLPLSISSIESLKDGRYIFTASFNLDNKDLFLETLSKRKEHAQKLKDEDYFYELDEIPFYFNGASYISGSKTRAFIYDPDIHKSNLDKYKDSFEENFEKLSKEERMGVLGLTAISSSDENCDSFKLSEDENKVYIFCDEISNKVEPGTTIYELPLNSKSDYKVELRTQDRNKLMDKKDGCDVFCLFELDDKVYAFMSDHKSYGLNQNASLYFYDYEKKQFVLVSDKEYCLGNSVGTDIRYGGNKSFTIHDSNIYSLITDVNSSKIARISADNGELTILDMGMSSIDGFDFMDGGILSVSFDGARPQEVYWHELKKNSNSSFVEADKLENFSKEDSGNLGEIQVPFSSGFKRENYSSLQLSKFNDEALGADFRGLECETFHFERKGTKHEGFVLRPFDYQEGKKYPAILDIHGGPKTVYGTLYYHEMQYWASKGYFVFFMNPHGSDGRGDKYSDIYGHYGEEDYQDLMKMTDVFLEKYPEVDAARLGVTGGSYGGFMTNWIIGHTDRFKAAATQRSISNWLSFYGTSDIGYYFAKDQCRGDIYDDKMVENLWRQSPLKYFNNVKTATLIIHSDQDYRCPLEQGMQVLTALIDRGIPAKMIQFKGENHDLSRSGRIKARLKRLDEITKWMDKYL